MGPGKPLPPDVIELAREQLGEALAELKDRGDLEEIVEARPAWVYPQEIVIGQYRKTAVDTRFFWVIGGNFPVDCIRGDLAATAREAARYFALKWQLDADRLAGADARVLQGYAEQLYELTDADPYWD